MFLEPENVAHYLADRDLLTLDSVVSGDFLVVEQSSRNYNLKVVREHSPGFFIKQLRHQTADMAQGFEREATCYRLAAEREAAALRPLLPTLHLFDPKRSILVVELIADAESIWEHHQRLGTFSVELAELQGERLGDYHASIDITKLESTGSSTFPRALPWILSIHRSNDAYIQQLSGGNAQIITILRQYPELPHALASIEQTWDRSTLIHGDIKWENLMVRPSEQGGLDLKIIDWELADLGDPCWDAGAIFQAYLSFWIFSLPLKPELSLADAAAGSPYDEAAMKRAMAAFWHRYARRRRLDATMFYRLRERAIRCAAARMIQTAFESVQQMPNVTPHALCQLQMSMNILKDPATAVRDLLETQEVH